MSMDSIIIGVILVLAVAYIGKRAIGSLNGKAGCGCGCGGDSKKKSSGNCGCGGGNCGCQ